MLTLFGRVIARANKELVIVPAEGTAEAVRVGSLVEDGKIRIIEKGVIANSDHTFVYADQRLMDRLIAIDKDIAKRGNVTLLTTPIEIELWLDSARRVLEERGIEFP